MDDVRTYPEIVMIIQICRKDIQNMVEEALGEPKRVTDLIRYGNDYDNDGSCVCVNLSLALLRAD